MRIVAGSTSTTLAEAVSALAGAAAVVCEVERFPDGELRPEVGFLRGDDVYVVQSTGPPVSDSVVELLLLLDACRRAGAGRLTAVVPYFGYARQDRRSRTGQAVGARVMADAVAGAGAQRMVVVDPHTVALEAMCAVPVEMLTAVPVLAGALRIGIGAGAVVVAPDLGAVKLAQRYANLLGAPVAVVRKHRLTGSAVRSEEVVGDVRDRPAVVVDDMISTAGTVEAACRVLAAHGAAPGPVVAATHAVLVGSARQRLEAAGISRLLVTDTVATRDAPWAAAAVESVAPLLADAVGRLHRDEAIDDLLVHG